MRTLRTFLIIVIMFFCAITASAQKPLTKPEKPTQTAPAEKSGSTTNKSSGKSTKGYINGHEYVDLGLSVKWATCNVGASSPSDYGNYYAWGETSTKSEYTMENSITYEKNIRDIAGNSTYDVARAKWGGTWRLPTRAEIDELVSMCKCEWTTQGGQKGCKIIGPNGDSIFLPANGLRDGLLLNFAEEYGSYWSATPYGDNTDYAYCLSFGSDSLLRGWGSRDGGQSVRPVSE